jgi:hypothetical protein
MTSGGPVYGKPFPIQYEHVGDTAYVVRRGFCGLAGHKFERNQVVPTWTNEWRVIKVLGKRHLLIGGGFLEEIVAGTPVLLCPCHRFWLTVGALSAHGCFELEEADSPPQELDSKIMRLWREGLEGPAIAERLSIAPKTVQNRVTELRKLHGEGVVPYHRATRR